MAVRGSKQTVLQLQQGCQIHRADTYGHTYGQPLGSAGHYKALYPDGDAPLKNIDISSKKESNF